MANRNALDLDLWEAQFIYWRTHLDLAIEQMFPPVKFTPDQHVSVRAMGNCDEVKDVKSRGAGKTWETAWACFGIAVLYPFTPIAVCSGTARQASLVLEKIKMIAEQNANARNELVCTNGKYVTSKNERMKCTFKNGSTIESFAVESMRGLRAKVIVIDECPEVPQEDQDAIVSPISNYKREIAFNHGFPDFRSKIINITSACDKSNSFYSEFIRVLKNMAKGREGSFACALNYKAAADCGITDMEFFMKEKASKPAAIFAMEYDSIFIGANANSAFDYELINGCRKAIMTELQQPKSSTSRYIISIDLATSTAKDSDNTIISVLKFMERNDGSFNRKLVFMKSFNGEPLDRITEYIRVLVHERFPNTEKIIYDARGLGDSFNRFFDKEWIGTDGKEYPPLVVDDEPIINPNSIPLLHPFRAVNSLNQRIYSNLRVALEQKRIELPITEREVNAKSLEPGSVFKNITREVRAIYQETDALQIEMGNIIAKIGVSGNVIYDTPNAKQHKDRYSSLAMGNDYISEIEKVMMAQYGRGQVCVGIATNY